MTHAPLPRQARSRFGAALRAGIAVLLCTALGPVAGCGQKGPLVLPSPAPGPAGGIPADTGSDEDSTDDAADGEADGG